MTAQPALDELPTEILHEVALLLDRDSICSLRLVSRSLQSRACQGIFDNFLPRIAFGEINGEVDWLEEDTAYRYLAPNLRQSPLFDWKAQPAPPRRSELQRVSITGMPVSACATRTLSSSPRAETLTDIVQPSTRGISIDFRLGKARSGEELEGETAFSTAGFVVHTTLLSLVADTMLVEEMTVFGWGRRIGLACNFVGPIVDSLTPCHRFQKLKRLSLCLSQHFKRSRTPVELDESREAGERNADAIRRFIQLFPCLQVLVLRWYRLCGKGGPGWSAAHEEEDRFLEHIAELPQQHWRHLRELRLKGVHTSPTTLLKLINGTPQLRQLTMESIRLTTGTYRPVFDVITEKLRLDYLYLDDLWEVPGGVKTYDYDTLTYVDCDDSGGYDEPGNYNFYPLVCFDAPGEPRLAYNGDNGPDTLTRTGWGPRETVGGVSTPSWLSTCVDRCFGQIQPRIGYLLVFGSLQSQPGLKRWREHLQALFGAEDRGGNG